MVLYHKSSHPISRILIYNHNQYENRRKTYGTNQKSYDNEFKAQAVKLAQEIGGHKAAQELGIPKGTMYTWIKAFKEGRLSANEAVLYPEECFIP